MAAKIIMAPEVEQDILGAYSWYENRRAGLGEEFLSCVDACIQRVLRQPDAAAYVHEEYRRVLVRRFPYAIFYEYDGLTATIYCIVHTSRDPNKWRDRLP